MNIVITQRDKKLLSYLIAFVVLIGFAFLVFKPLWDGNKQLEGEIELAKTQADYELSQETVAATMQKTAAETQVQLQSSLERYYPMLQSQEIESILTQLMLYYGDQIQSLTIAMPQKAADLEWYQYADATQASTGEVPAEEIEQSTFAVYAARVSCLIEGDRNNLQELVDTIAFKCPAMSITSLEWTYDDVAAPVEAESEEVAEADEENEAEVEPQSKPATITVHEDKLSLNLEIYMCDRTVTQ